MISTFWIVVPFYNEEKGIAKTLQALAAQSDRNFELVLVNNVSTDGSLKVIERELQKLKLVAHIIDEPQKGTGAAVDSGFRYAIDKGAQYLARTDADCIPARDWVEKLKLAFSDDLEFIGGKIKPRKDDIPLRLADHIVLPAMVTICEWYGKIFWRGPQFKYTFFMAAGNNVAITSSLYVKSGGFQRSAIDDTDEDKMLAETIRTMTTKAAHRKEIVVYNSIRRARKYGYLKTLRWYSNRHYRGEVDIR
jgi:glycosyltransferase involved in cell wall biosynthesis